MDSRFVSVLGIAVLAGTLAACAGSQPHEFGRGEADQLRQLVRQFVAAYNKQDVDGVLNVFSGTASLLPPNSSPIRGKDSIRGYFDIRLLKEGATDLQLDVTDVGGQGTLAYATGNYSLRLTPTEGPESRDRGKVMWIVKNLAGRWWVEYSIWNSDLPLPQPAPAPAEKEKKK